MSLKNAKEGFQYIIREVLIKDEELESFLFSLGCYAGEPITVIKNKKSGCIVSVKDSRYSIDKYLAEAILV